VAVTAVTVTLCLALSSGGSAASSDRTAAPGNTWGTIQKIPGTTGRQGAINSVSCASPGNCSAVGEYYVATSTGSDEYAAGFVVSQVNGTWEKAQAVPDTADVLNSVSCMSPGNCSAGGTQGNGAPFVVSQMNGTWEWGKAQVIPSTLGIYFTVSSVSCGSPGNCSATGEAAGPNSQAFVASEVNGKWGKAQVIPSTLGISSMVNSVSCGSPGNCSAGGYTEPSSGGTYAFVISEVNGTWEQMQGVTSITSTDSTVNSVSCPSPGNCSAGGSYVAASGHQQAFVVNKVNGTWGQAKEVPGSGVIGIDSVWCASAGNCSAGGTYEEYSGYYQFQTFVVNKVNGTWGSAQELPGLAALNAGGASSGISVSCAAAGDCSASGSYTDASGNSQAYIDTQMNGVWGTAEELPGSAALTHGAGTSIYSLSCPPEGGCVVGGSYQEASGGYFPFVSGEVVPLLAALGDSYSSGEGAGSYYPGTGSAQGCHRSPNAWPVLLQDYLVGQAVLLPHANFLACSGATSKNLGDRAFNGEQPQLNILRKLSPHPAVITMTMGGNDLHFADVLKDCYTNACTTGHSIDKRLKNVQEQLPGEEKVLENDYSLIARAEPSATILIVDYPQIFIADSKIRCEGAPKTVWGFSPQEQTELDRLTAKVDGIIAAAAAADAKSGEHVHYVDVTRALAGHELCRAHPWVSPVGLGRHFVDGQQQGHLTTPGQQEIAKYVAGYIAKNNLKF
jgi:lysophospholipase L1-like esterase